MTIDEQFQIMRAARFRALEAFAGGDTTFSMTQREYLLLIPYYADELGRFRTLHGMTIIGEMDIPLPLD